MKTPKWVWIALGVAALVAFGPLLFDFFSDQWTHPEYQGFPLVFAAVAFFTWQRWGEREEKSERSNWLYWFGLGVIVLGLLTLAFAAYIFSPWLGLFAWGVFTFGIVACVRSRYSVPALWGIWASQLVLLPPPLNYDRRFVAELQLFSSWLSSKVLDAFGVFHVMQGNTLKLEDKQLFVDEACSGIVSLISIITCIVIYSIWQRRALFHVLMLIVLGVVWVTLMNSVRICTIAIAYEWLDLDWTEGLPHTMLGLVLFAASLGVIYCLDRFLGELLAPVNAEWRAKDLAVDHRGLSLMYVWDWLFSTARHEEMEEDAALAAEELVFEAPKAKRSSSPVGVNFLLFSIASLVCLAVWQLGLLQFGREGEKKAIEQSVIRAISLDESFAVVRNAALTQVNFEAASRGQFDAWGENSRSYFFDDATGKRYQLSCDFLFGPFWHDLQVCYRGNGWQIKQNGVREITTSASDLQDDPDWKVQEIELERQEGAETGYVLCAAFRANGNSFNPPFGASWLYDFVTHAIQGRDRSHQANYYQVQVAVFGTPVVTEENREMARVLLAEARERLRLAITSPENAPTQPLAKSE